jgi:radical SAM superfamily enzyme YgiQ (UPF0313 family)
MKILLIQPPLRDFYQTTIRTQPIGLAYLAASLKSHGVEVEILDCQTERKKSIPIPSELSYLMDFYPFKDQSPFKLYTGYYHFGMDWDEIRRRIEDSKADVFGISSSFTPYHGEALEIARIIKERDERKIVVMGGPHVSCDPEGVLKSPFVDYAILGEGEIRLPLLLKEMEKGNRASIEMDGIGYRANGNIRINRLKSFIQNLDHLPFPARELFDPDRYRIKKKRTGMILTSRGCPHRCAYCSAHLVMGTSFRARSPESILQEMKECHKRYDIQIFDFEDDNFTFDQVRAKRLMNLIIEAFGEGTLELSAMNGISFASLDEELLHLMKKAGFRTMNLSFVSTDQPFKRRMGRPGPESGFDQVLQDAEKIGLHVIAYGILGIPGQTIEEMVNTLIYLMGKQVLIGPSVYYPTPGTPLFERCREEDLLPPDQLQWRSSAFPIETKEFSRLDLVTLFRLARLINFVKGKMDQKELDEGMTWKELYKAIKDKVKAKVEVNQKVRDEVKVEVENNIEDKVKANTPCALRSALSDNVVTWMDLVSALTEERSFFALMKEHKKTISAMKVPTSKKVLDCFFEKAWAKPVLRSRNI